jgi:hypothetical protein
VAGVLAGRPDFFDVLHEVGEVLEVGLVPEDVLYRGLDLYALVNALSHEKSHPFFFSGLSNVSTQ